MRRAMDLSGKLAAPSTDATARLHWEFFCEHANENPYYCPCPLTCGCHTQSTMCRDKVNVAYGIDRRRYFYE